MEVQYTEIALAEAEKRGLVNDVDVIDYREGPLGSGVVRAYHHGEFVYWRLDGQLDVNPEDVRAVQRVQAELEDRSLLNDVVEDDVREDAVRGITAAALGRDLRMPT